MARWKSIDQLPLEYRAGYEYLLRLSRLEGRREVKGYWTDGGPHAGQWVDLDGELIKPQQYLDASED